ncbi:uncharacterized protein KIAA0513 homolog isoform X1 [Hyla sarda]|uniref:uncharacterized protein KIAA0513 homolog isoform X1 n=1 Tax=Hyla sarda TaxID=327740 RepID=UPI0024C3B18F|nr:uncharacterized protein KIAA0513 homolog isoform X1 [Hyla sarda]XP_056381508.1 uncharacterized protein KIAA0513 homolog isoform X1 [Hyla sarda]
METPDVPVGNLIDLDTEPLVVLPACPPKLDTDEILVLEETAPENGERGEEIESDATESADSDNDMASTNRHCWNHSQRSSSESFSSNQSTESTRDEQMAEHKEFIRQYVDKIFTGGEDVDQEEKARFGELCSTENGKGREWFARFVSAQRCNSKCVSEQTFYRLVQSFAVVLFECYQMDDFGPAKNLMTMCFTYYYIGKPHVSPTDSREKPVSTGSIDGYLKSANSWLAEKKDNVERLLRTTSVTTENMKGFFGGLEIKLKGPLSKKNEQSDEPSSEKPSNDIPLQSPDEKKGEKMYLYSHLKQQPIWHSLRFWNAAFFDAVHCERRKRSPTTRRSTEEDERDKWYHMTQEERDDSLQFNENITFGQLGTFTHNMLAFGLSKKLCSDFLKKQAVIGNLDEEKFKQLTDYIDRTAVE